MINPVELLERFQMLSDLGENDYDKIYDQEELDYLIDLIKKDMTEVD